MIPFCSHVLQTCYPPLNALEMRRLHEEKRVTWSVSFYFVVFISFCFFCVINFVDKYVSNNESKSPVHSSKFKVKLTSVMKLNFRLKLLCCSTHLRSLFCLPSTLQIPEVVINFLNNTNIQFLFKLFKGDYTFWI